MYMILQIITVRKTLSIQVLKMADDSSRWPIFLKGTDISTKN